MKKLKNIFTVIFMLALTVLVMLVPVGFNTFSDYYLGRVQIASEPEIADINTVKKLTKQETAEILFNSGISQLDGYRTEADENDIITDCKNIFTDILSDNSAVAEYFIELLNESGIVSFETQYFMSIADGDSVVLQIVNAVFGNGINITYEKENYVVMNIYMEEFRIQDSMTAADTKAEAASSFYIDRLNTAIEYYYLEIIETKDFYNDTYVLDGVKYFTAGLDFYFKFTPSEVDIYNN